MERLGSVAAAAKELGINRSTCQRDNSRNGPDDPAVRGEEHAGKGCQAIVPAERA